MNANAIEHLELDEIETPSALSGDPLIKRDLALVGHVPVRLSAVVGDLELPIDTLFALKAGSVLTLEQTLEAPILLQVNNRPVAEAELVAVDDHFGVRITRVLE